MSSFTKYREGTFSDEELETFSKELIIAKLDRDKRKEWEQKLKTEYAVEKTAPKNKRRFLLFAIAASLLLGLALFAIPYTSSPNYLSLVDEEISNLSIMSDQSIIRKGKQDIEVLRKEASLAYVEKNYAKSIQLFGQINDSAKLTETDCFYLGLSHLKKEAANPEQTAFWLEKARALNPQRYREEIAWVLALAYLKNGEKEKAQQELKTIINDYQYKADEAKKILELLD